MSDFNYNAPQYIDFTSDDLDSNEYGDEYFEVDHEFQVGEEIIVNCEVTVGEKTPIIQPFQKDVIKQNETPLSTNSATSKSEHEMSSRNTLLNSTFEKSLHIETVLVGNLEKIEPEIVSLSCNNVETQSIVEDNANIATEINTECNSYDIAVKVDFQEEGVYPLQDAEDEYDQTPTNMSGVYVESDANTASQLCGIEVKVDFEVENTRSLEDIECQVRMQTEQHYVSRKSLSTGDIPHDIMQEVNGGSVDQITEALNTLDINNKKKLIKINGIMREVLPSKLQLKPLSGYKPRMSERGRCLSKDSLSNLNPINNKLKRKTSAENINPPNKYISLAEAVNKFQFVTPKRFHTKSSKTTFHNVKANFATNSTVPQSPQLATKARIRPVIALTREEKEQKEAEEMKKYHIKARPINHNIFRTPVLKVEKKPVTEPQPFKFTEVAFHKPVQPQLEEVYEFHARPAPKMTAKPVNVRYSSRQVDLNNKLAVMRKLKVETVPTVNETSDGRQVCLKQVALAHDGVRVTPKSNKTKIEPFSFEERNKQLQIRKQEKIRQFLESEKKAREFHANPIPAKVLSGSSYLVASKLLNDNTMISVASKNDENIEPIQNCFKARPATAVHKKPFVPKRLDRPLLEVQEFNLSTLKRAKEREEYDRMLKVKEMSLLEKKKNNEEQLRQLELQEINEMRKECVHKAKPVKHYKVLEIVASSQKLTTPKSPQFVSKQKQNNAEQN